LPNIVLRQFQKGKIFRFCNSHSFDRVETVCFVPKERSSELLLRTAQISSDRKS